MKTAESGVIYLDYHSTTPCDPRVVEAMLPFFTALCANPSNGTHALGRATGDAVERARERVAALIGASAGEIVFTGGATESNNLAILGLARRADPTRNKLVVTPIEHKSVLEACRHLARLGHQVAYLPVDSTGTVDIDAAARVIDERTLLVCVQAANNEIGTIEPVAVVAALAHSRGAAVHCDAAQAVGRVPLSVDELDVDLLSISAHKIYGPKGVGALYVRGGATTRRLSPLVHGGGQERGLRPGTLNVPGIVGLGTACTLCGAEMADESRRVGWLRDLFEERLFAIIPGLIRNGSCGSRLPGNSSLTLPGVDADALLLNTPELALSTGSACASGAPEPSHVLTAIGLAREAASSTIRVGLGRLTTEAEVSAAADLIAAAYKRLLALGS